MDALVQAYQQQRIDSIKDQMFIGWHVAAFGRAKTIPDLSRWIARTFPNTTPKQTMDEQIAVARNIVALWSPPPGEGSR